MLSCTDERLKAEEKAAKRVARKAAKVKAFEDVKKAGDASVSKKRKRSEDDEDDATNQERKNASKERKMQKHQDDMAAEAEKRVVEKAARKAARKLGKRKGEGINNDSVVETSDNEAISTDKPNTERKIKSNNKKLDREIAKREAKRIADCGSNENEGPQYKHYDKHGRYAQWNPDALSGGSERQDKFLKLLGAKKTGKGETIEKKARHNANVAEISKVESELERQFESGIKMKHDGGSKRRGLGA